MSEPWLVDLADRFWAAAGGPPVPPRDLHGVVSLALPVTVVALPALSLLRVERWFSARNVDHRFDVPDRRLRGCLVAFGGHGFIFVDGADPVDERRLTLAHEVAHFLLDDQHPRERATRALGDGIAAVLGGKRSPTLDERIGTVLSAVRLSPHTHLMERSGGRGAAAAAVEAGADRLAWELLAPAAEVSEFVAGSGGEALEQALVDRYGLPRNAAARYARSLRRVYEPPPSFVDWLRVAPR
ncbi:MAG: hypothetical protein QOG89_3058 [Thermomicrobiales bacterium]|nr:hypothetical protein [Thermomicrobiales bacterium]